MSDSTPAPANASGRIVGILALAGIIASVMQTLVVPLIGELPRILHTSASNATWAVTATLLAGAVATPVTGRLGDLYGKKLMMMVLMLPLVAGSIMCALAGSLVPMIAGRGLQGIGMGIVPLAISSLRDLLPQERLGSAIALISASMGIGGALGLPIAAAVAEKANWRVLFWAMAVLCAGLFLLIWRLIPTPPTRATGRFDVVGAIGLGAALICLLVGVSKGGDWGWGSGTELGLFGAAVVLLAAWGWWELRRTDPLVDLRVTARPQVLLTNAASVVVGFAMYAQALLAPQLLQLPKATGYGLGTSMLTAGLCMAPGGLGMMLLSPVGGKLSAARGPKVTLFVGALVIAAGYLAAAIGLMGSIWGLVVVSGICSAGVGLAYGAMPALIMSAVPLSETASANAFNTLMRSIGTSTSAAVIGVVLAHLTTQFAGQAVPSESAFRIGMLIGAGTAFLAAVVTLAVPGRRAARAQERPVALDPATADR